MKRTMFLVALLILALALGACRSAGTAEAPSATPVPPTFTSLPPTAPPTPTTAPPTATTEAPTATPIPASPTPPPPTAIPATATPTPQPSATRIAFEPGGTSATVTGSLPAGGEHLYVLGAMQGQLMNVTVLAPQGAARLAIYGADGAVLASGMGEYPAFQGTVPKTQDYYIRVESNMAINYSLSVTIPVRIAFAPGATSATIEGRLSPFQGRDYVLGAMAGQLMDVTVAGPPGTIRLVIYGADGTVLKSGMSEATGFRAILPTTQDYFIHIDANAAVNYTLSVIIPQRIAFAPGATSAVLQGQLLAWQSREYVLGISEGQRLRVDLTAPAGAARLVIYGMDGTVLQSGMGDLTMFEGVVPSTQQYIIRVDVNSPVQYTLEVVIPRRIEFAPGATSATVQGAVSGGGAVHYILGASAGQTMSVSVTSPGYDVFPTIYGVDGSVLKRAQDGSPAWVGVLTLTQDYWVVVMSFGGDTTYTLEIAITG